jgi:hypothetical protein
MEAWLQSAGLKTLRLADLKGAGLSAPSLCETILHVGVFFHCTCVLRHNTFWLSATNLGLAVTAKQANEVREGCHIVQDGASIEPRQGR